MRRRTIVLGLGLSIAHLVITLLLAVASFGRTMAHFDAGTLPEGTDAQMSSAMDLVVTLLMTPGMAVYALVPSALQSSPVEWTLMLLNSALWGFGLLLLWRLVTRRRRAA